MKRIEEPAREMGIVTLEQTAQWILRKLSDGSYELIKKTFEGSPENWSLHFTGIDAVKLEQKLDPLSLPRNMSTDTFLRSIWHAHWKQAKRQTP